jgi:thioredoxin
MGAIHLTKEDFLRKVADINAGGDWKFLGDKPAVIDFYAPWCGPCKMLSPVIDEVANEYEGRVDIYKISVDDEQELAAHFGVRSVPTLFFIPMDGTPQMSLGAMPKGQLKNTIDALLK